MHVDLPQWRAQAASVFLVQQSIGIQCHPLARRSNLGYCDGAPWIVGVVLTTVVERRAEERRAWTVCRQSVNGTAFHFSMNCDLVSINHYFIYISELLILKNLLNINDFYPLYL